MLEHLNVVDSTLIKERGVQSITNYIYRPLGTIPRYPRPGTFYWMDSDVDRHPDEAGLYFADSKGNIYRLNYEKDLHNHIAGMQGEVSSKIDDATFYNPQDNYLTNAIGDIPSNLKKNDPFFGHQQVGNILDRIIFPTVQPIVTEGPQTSISYNNSSKDGEIIVLKVGAILNVSQFTGTQSTGSVDWVYNDGVITHLGDYTGNPTVSTTISPGSFGNELTEGTHTVTRKVTYANGNTYKTNKQGTSNLPAYEGGSISNTKVFHVVCPIRYNGNSISNLSDEKFDDYIGKDGEIIIDIPKETETNKFQLEVPSHLEFEVKQFNPLSETYGPTIKMIEIASGTIMGGIKYNRYARTSDKNSIQSESRYKIIIKKVEK